MKDMDKLNKIAELLYDSIGYCYCDNCGTPDLLREDQDLDPDPHDPENLTVGDLFCEGCHRKYSNWRLSKSSAKELAERILNIE